MKGFREALKRHRWSLALLGVLWVLAGCLPTDAAGGAAIGLVFVSAVVSATAYPDHPLRNGALGGLFAWYLGMTIVCAVQTLLGTIVIAEGETLGSLWLELPFFLTLFAPIGIVAGLAGGLVARFVRRGRHGSAAS